MSEVKIQSLLPVAAAVVAMAVAWGVLQANTAFASDERERIAAIAKESLEKAQENGQAQAVTEAKLSAIVAMKEAGLSEVVITSVTRDDLNDGGADIWARTIAAVRQAAPSVMLEVLVPDFAGNESAIERVLAAKPDVFGHNLETVPRLYADVRPEANYTRSLELLGQSASCGLITKTSLMLGLGETIDEVAVVMSDARERGCRVFFLGQYLRPSKEHCAVERYVEPDEFEELKRRGVELGFDVVVSAPLVRSSYHSDEQTDFVKRVLIEKG